MQFKNFSSSLSVVVATVKRFLMLPFSMPFVVQFSEISTPTFKRLNSTGKLNLALDQLSFFSFRFRLLGVFFIVSRWVHVRNEMRYYRRASLLGFVIVTCRYKGIIRLKLLFTLHFTLQRVLQRVWKVLWR